MPGPRDKRDNGDNQRPRRHERDVRRATASTPLFGEGMRRQPEAWDGGVDAADEPCCGEQRAVHGGSLQFTVNSSQLEALPNCMSAMKTADPRVARMTTLQEFGCAQPRAAVPHEQ